uniref:Uncharacterized protein n=1 Tax=Zea mays TaxID=4577 RepID=A0A804PIM7_MAIZE
MSDRSTRRAPCGVIHRRCLVHGHYVKPEHDLTRKERGQKLSTTLRSRYRTCICCLPVGWKLGRRANLIGTRWILTKPSARVVWRATVREGWSLADDDDDDGRDGWFQFQSAPHGRRARPELLTAMTRIGRIGKHAPYGWMARTSSDVMEAGDATLGDSAIVWRGQV